MLKPGEAEAIQAWWRRQHALQGLFAGFATAAIGLTVGSILYAAGSAFIDLN